MNRDEQAILNYLLLEDDEHPDTDEDPELAAHYRDLAEVNEAIANLYQ